MSFWDLLGIEPTADTKVIKKAYSQKLKGLDRENDIEGFQTLHAAYQSALAAAAAPSKTADLTERATKEIRETLADPLAVALDVFFESLKSAKNREDFEDPYQTLRAHYALDRDLLRTNQMESFLVRLSDLLCLKPFLAHPALLHNLFRDLGLEDDVALYQQFASITDRIWWLVHYERQKEVWLHRVDHKTAAILLDSDLRAGYADRRKSKVLANINSAICLIETEFPLLAGRFITLDKIQFWKDLQRSWLITYDDLIVAFSAFLILPTLKAALLFHPISQGIPDALLLISYPLGLMYLLLSRRLRARMQDDLDANSTVQRLWALRNNGRVILTLLILNGAWAALSVAGQLVPTTHAVAVLGLISLFLVIPMPFVLIGTGTFFGSVLLAILLPAGQTIDLALAAQLGTPLLFLLARVPVFLSAIHRKIRPNASTRPGRTPNPESPTRPRLNFLTIVVAITLVRILSWIITNLF